MRLAPLVVVLGLLLAGLVAAWSWTRPPPVSIEPEPAGPPSADAEHRPSPPSDEREAERFAARWSGRILDRQQRPVDGATLSVQRHLHLAPLPRPVVEELARTTTDPEGRFELSFEDHGPSRHRSLVVSHPRLRTTRIDALPATPRLDLGERPLAAGFTLRGRISTEAGPLSSARLRVLDADLESGLEWSTVLDTDGRFVLSGLPSPEVVAIVEDAEQGLPPTELRLSTRTTEHVVERSVAAALEGRVTGLADDHPAMLRLSRCGPQDRGSALVETGADGRFRFEALRSGYYSLRVEHPMHRALVLDRLHRDLGELELALPPAATATLRLPGLGTTEAEVQLLGAEPGSGARGQPVQHAVREGRLVIPGLPPGPARLRLRIPAQAPITTPRFELEAGAITDFGEFVRSPGWSLRGSIELPAGCQGALVRLAPAVDVPGPAPLERCAGHRVQSPDPGARFHFEGLGPGEHVLELTAQGARPLRRSITLDRPETLLEPLRPRPAARLVGRVLDARGQPRPDTPIALRQGPRRLQQRSDAEGRFDFEELAPGTVTLSLPDERPDEDALLRALQGGSDRGARRIELAVGTNEVELRPIP